MKATDQLELPNMSPRYVIRPSSERPAPAFWVKRLVVARELSADTELIRDVVLRPGLNIVWTPPQERDETKRLFSNGMAGHTAGKTTFCRLIRHALGEQGLLNERARRKVRMRFPHAWLLAEVVVGGDAWTVARPFAIGPHSFAIRGGSIEDALMGGERTGYQDYLAALSSVVVDLLPSREIPGSDAALRWDHVLPWLSRDQECRFGDFLEWRHSASNSDSPELNMDERRFLIRAILGVIGDEERMEQIENARLLGLKKVATQRIPLLRHQASVDRERVTQARLVELIGLSAGELFATASLAALDERHKELSRQLSASSSPESQGPVAGALELRDEAVRLEANAERGLAEAMDRHEIERRALESLENGDASLLGALEPPRDYCNQPMHIAREKCPLASTRTSELLTMRSERVAEDEVRRRRKLVADLDDVILEKEATLQTRKTASADARRQEFKVRTAVGEQRDRLRTELVRIEDMRRRIDEALRAEEEASRLTEEVSDLSRKIEESYKRQKELRVDSSQAISDLSRTFDYVARAILGDEVHAAIETSGRSLALSIDHHGERDSAAIETVKLLAFDLAAMTESIQGRGYFPRFLLHDGPREADLSASVYENFFHFVHELESCFEKAPSFQYIVTTTSPPPEALLREPWLRVKLAGIPSEDRLLRCDL